MKKLKEMKRFAAVFENVRCRGEIKHTFTSYGNTEEEAVENLYRKVSYNEEHDIIGEELEATKRFAVFDMETGMCSYMMFNVVIFHYVFDHGRIDFEQAKEHISYTRKYAIKIPEKYLIRLLDNKGFTESTLYEYENGDKRYYRSCNSVSICYNKNLSFHIDPTNVKIGMCMYATCAKNSTGCYSTETNYPEFFYPRLLMLLNGEITAEDVIKEVVE